VAEAARVGFRTVTSCQRGSDGRAYLEFDSVTDAVAFMEIAIAEFSADLESVWNRAMRDDEPEVEWDTFRHHRMWSYDASPHDYSVIFKDPEAGDKTLVREGLPDIDFSITVRFPPGDIPYLVDRIRDRSPADASQP
jgi:hypothetical protein